MTKKTKNNYVDNKRLWDELVSYKTRMLAAKEAGKVRPVPNDYIGKCFIDISDHLGQMNSFRGYSFLDEMKLDAIENCCLYIDAFNPEKSKNPFAYFTLTVYRAFLRRIAREKKQLYIKYKSTQLFGILDDLSWLDDDNKSKQFETYDNILDFIHTFEEGKKTKKKKAKGLEKFVGE